MARLPHLNFTRAEVCPLPTAHFIPRPELIANQPFYPNKNGNCGWVAASLVLNYWQQMGYEILPKYYIDEAMCPDLTKNLPGLLQQISHGFTSTYGPEIYISLLRLNQRSGNPFHINLYPGHLGLKRQLKNGYPSIVLGRLPNPQRGGGINHVVTAYGLTEAGDIVTHYGWSGFEQVTIKRALIGASIGIRPR